MPTQTIDWDAWIVGSRVYPRLGATKVSFGDEYGRTLATGDAEFELQGSDTDGVVTVRVNGTGPSVDDWCHKVTKPFMVKLIVDGTEREIEANLQINLNGKKISELQ